MNCGKQPMALETAITWNGAAHTVLKRAPLTNLGFPTAGQGTFFAEDSPTGLANENVIVLTGPAAGTAFESYYAWRNFKKWLVDKVVVNVATAMSATANAGNDCNYDSLEITLRELFPNGTLKNIIDPTGIMATGHTTLTGAGVQTFIYENPFTPNYTTQDNSWFILGVKCNITVGTATVQNGIYPAFPFQKNNSTKWYSQSGVYLLGRSII